MNGVEGWDRGRERSREPDAGLELRTVGLMRSSLNSILTLNDFLCTSFY